MRDSTVRVRPSVVVDGSRPADRFRRGAAIWRARVSGGHRPGTDIQRARRERSFISMETTGPTLRHNLAANGPPSSPWHRRGTFGRQS
jgi:hypothetical protein